MKILFVSNERRGIESEMKALLTGVRCLYAVAAAHFRPL